MRTDESTEIKKHPSIDEMIAKAKAKTGNPPTGTTANGTGNTIGPRELGGNGNPNEGKDEEDQENKEKEKEKDDRER